MKRTKKKIKEHVMIMQQTETFIAKSGMLIPQLTGVQILRVDTTVAIFEEFSLLKTVYNESKDDIA